MDAEGVARDGSIENPSAARRAGARSFASGTSTHSGPRGSVAVRVRPALGLGDQVDRLGRVRSAIEPWTNRSWPRIEARRKPPEDGSGIVTTRNPPSSNANGGRHSGR